MNICPITYKPSGDKKYSQEGLKKLSKNLTELNDLPFTQSELIKEAAARATKMSIAGVQPKLSAKLNIKEQGFEVVDRFGEYILKPQSSIYSEVPENEDLTMHLAEIVDIEVPLHGLIYSADDKLTYFTKRFDRYGRNKKLALEDFAQLAGRSRETKYDFSMEKMITLLDQYCTFPLIEKVRLFRITIFNFLTGNEDMHLKNFSVIIRNDKVELSPAYDLLNSTIALASPREEIALPLMGKKSNLSRKILFNYWGKEKLNLNETVLTKIQDSFASAIREWEGLISRSFLSDIMKEKYLALVHSRLKRLELL